MPTHPHNKAPTADRLVAGGGFSLDVAQRQNAFARQDTLYIGIADRSARPFVRQRPECAAFVDARQLVGRHSSRRSAKSVRPSGKSMRKARGFSLFPSTFPRKTHLSKKRSCVSLPASPTGSPPRPGHRGKISHRRGESAQKCACVHFFLFLLAFYAGKTRYICTENLFYQLRMAKSRRFVPVFVCPPECSPTFLPSL